MIPESDEEFKENWNITVLKEFIKKYVEEREGMNDG